MPQSRSVHTPPARVYPSPVSAYRSSTRVRLVGALLGALLGLAVVPDRTLTADTERSRATLRGLPGVQVVVEKLSPEVEQAGLTKQQLQTDVELRLRQSGIRVLTREERLATEGQPYLYINVNILLYRELRLTVFNIDVELTQVMLLATGGGEPVMAATWDTGEMGGVALTELSRIRELVRDQVDIFINAYLSVNPRPAGSPPPAQTAPPKTPKPATGKPWIDVLPDKPPPGYGAPSPAPQPAQRTR